MKPIIRVQGLGKQYRLNAGNQPYGTLREAIVGTFRKPLGLLDRGRQNPQNTIWALRDVSFNVFPGEVVGIIGRNGAGKSTLLKLLSRVVRPTAGRAELYGRFGSLLEVGTGFHPELTGRENIFLNGSILGMRRTEIRKQFDEIVAFAEVERFLDTPVKRYSSGMYVRLAFAVAAHLQTEILIIDEVLAVGDHTFQQKCLSKMQDVSSDGRTILFVSHNIGAVSRLCARCLLLDGGQVREAGPTTAIVQAYLTAGAPHRAEIDFDPRPDQDVNLRSVRLRAGGEVRGEVGYHEDLGVEVEYEIHRPLRGATIGVGLFSIDGTCVFLSADYDGDPGLLARDRTPGRYRTSLTIPRRWLNPGRYVIHASATNVIGDVFANVEALSFTIIDTGSPGAGNGTPRRGVLQPALDWTTSAVASHESAS
jgi:lipopolysaccharide transport system ATP-binding protein